MIEGARLLPTQHISIRVPWHDSGWSGRVCANPLGNTHCIALPRICDTRDDAWETSVRGELFDAEGARLPACAAERGAFMADFGYERRFPHPYEHQAREHDPIAGMANRDLLANSFTPFSFRPNPLQHEVMNRINKAGRNGFAVLERWDLIEPADDMNGRNGYVVLTTKGRGTTERTDFEPVRVRGLLRAEMLHPLLRGKPYDDFVADHLDAAVLEAFKTVEIEVRTAAARPESEHGKDLMFRAFAVNGPLFKPGETKSECEALAGLFAGALSRFRNPGAHTRRSFADVLEAMEELMVASRLLRIVDERRPPEATI